MKHRTLIEMLAFITVALLVIVLYFSGVTVFAESNDSVKPIEKYQIDKICTSNNDFTEYSFNNLFLYPNYRSEVKTYTDIINNNPSLVDVESIGAYLSSYSNYCWTTDGFWFCDDKSFLAVSNSMNEENTFYFHISSDLYNYLNSNSENYVTRAYINSFIVDINSSIQNIYASNCKLIDGEYYLPLGYHAQLLLNCNIMVYAFDGDTSRNVTTLQGATAISNNYVPATDETFNIREHLNFNPSYMYINCDSGFNGDGLVTVLGYDSNQKDNLDKYNISFDYDIDINVGGLLSGHFSKDGYSLSLSDMPSGRFSMSLPELFVTMYDGNKNAWELLKNVNVKNVNDKSELGVNAGFNGGPYGSVGLSYSQPISVGGDLKQCYFTAVATITTTDGVNCGSFDFQYDFLTGVFSNNTNFKNQNDVNETISNYNNSNNLTPSDTGYLDINKYQSTMPSSSNYPAYSGGSVSQGGSASAQGGVAYGSNVNNSVIVNTGQDVKEIIKYAKNELLPANYEGGYVEKLESVTDSNNFIQYMSTTFTFIPQTFWNDVAYYGKIALIILVSGFILSLVRRLIN